MISFKHLARNHSSALGSPQGVDMPRSKINQSQINIVMIAIKHLAMNQISALP